MGEGQTILKRSSIWRSSLLFIWFEPITIEETLKRWRVLYDWTHIIIKVVSHWWQNLKCFTALVSISLQLRMFLLLLRFEAWKVLTITRGVVIIVDVDVAEQENVVNDDVVKRRRHRLTLFFVEDKSLDVALTSFFAQKKISRLPLFRNFEIFSDFWTEKCR